MTNSKLDKFYAGISFVSGILGTCVTIVYTYVSYKNSSTTSFQEIIITLGVCVSALTFSFVVASYFYLKRLAELTNLNNTINETIFKNKQNEILIKNTSEITANLTYYQRHIINKLDFFIDNKDSLNQKMVNKISSDFVKFLSTFTSNLQAYFTLLSNDNCAVTIKIVKDDKVKTLFRDSVSYRHRKGVDTTPDGKDFIYLISENFGFHVIQSKDYRDTYYFSDDLKNDPNYFSRNVIFKNSYNATAVSPISIIIGKSKTELLGFICVDNFNGNLGQKTVEGMLKSAGALLFPIFQKYERIASFANTNKYHDNKVKFFTNWDNS